MDQQAFNQAVAAAIATAIAPLNQQIQQLENDRNALQHQIHGMQNPPPQPPQPVQVQVTQPYDLYRKPSPYKGERGLDAERFIVDIERYIGHHLTQLPTINDRVDLALSYMEDKAANWKQLYTNQMLAGNTPFADWNAFKRDFKLSFQPIDDVTAAMDELRRLSQGTDSAAGYHDTFNRVVMRTGLSDVDKRMRFYEGLNKAVKDALIYSSQDTTLYADLVKESIKLDNRITQRKWEEKQTQRTPVVNFPSNRFQKTPVTPTTPARDPNAMEVDTGKFPEDYRTCYNCGEKGHIRRFCKNPPKTRPQSVKATVTEAPKEEKKPVDVVQQIAASVSDIMKRLSQMEATAKDKEAAREDF